MFRRHADAARRADVTLRAVAMPLLLRRAAYAAIARCRFDYMLIMPMLIRLPPCRCCLHCRLIYCRRRLRHHHHCALFKYSAKRGL